MCFLAPSDSHGYIAPSLRPIWDLAFLGSSYVMWQKTTPFLHYYMSQISGVKQWVRKTKTNWLPEGCNQCNVLRINMSF